METCKDPDDTGMVHRQEPLPDTYEYRVKHSRYDDERSREVDVEPLDFIE